MAPSTPRRAYGSTGSLPEAAGASSSVHVAAGALVQEDVEESPFSPVPPLPLPLPRTIKTPPVTNSRAQSPWSASKAPPAGTPSNSSNLCPASDTSIHSSTMDVPANMTAVPARPLSSPPGSPNSSPRPAGRSAQGSGRQGAAGASSSPPGWSAASALHTAGSSAPPPGRLNQQSLYASTAARVPHLTLPSAFAVGPPAGLPSTSSPRPGQSRLSRASSTAGSVGGGEGSGTADDNMSSASGQLPLGCECQCSLSA